MCKRKKKKIRPRRKKGGTANGKFAMLLSVTPLETYENAAANYEYCILGKERVRLGSSSVMVVGLIVIEGVAEGTISSSS